MIELSFKQFINIAVKALLTIIFFGVAHNVFAQNLATVSGTVTDQNGAIVTGATVTVSSAALAIERTAVTSAEGTYSIPQLRPGLYSLTITQTGFQTSQVTDLELGAAQTRTFDVALLPGEATATVNVSSSEEPATIDQSSARLGTNLTAREVNELPVNGRQYTQLYLNAPGATNTGTGNANEIRFNGRSNEQNQVRYDGVEASAIFDASPGYTTVQGSQFRLQASLETIQEFRVDSSNYPAEQGTGTGGQINVVGKSGSNNFRGSAFYYFRNDALDARNFFDAGEPSRLQLNQFGFSLGGPIVKDRIFFFGNYEGLRQRAGFNSIELTPSTFARDFVNFFGTTNARGEAARAALGISTADATTALSRIQTLRASGAINAFPTGTGAIVSLGGVANGGQFIQTNNVARLDEDVFNARIDGRISDQFNFFLRANAPRGDIESPDATSGRVIVLSQKPVNFVGSLTQAYGAKIFNETKVGINKSPTNLDTRVPTAATAFPLTSTAIRLSGGFVNPGVNGAASTGIVDPGGLTRQSSAASGRAQPINGISYSVIDNLSVILGNHTAKFGGELRFNEVKFDQLGGTTLSYASLQDFLLNRNLSAAFIGDLSASGDFTIATNPLTTFSRPFDGIQPTARNRFYILYGQDEWKARENLTINYGLRFERYTQVKERNNRAIIVDAATGRVLPPDTDPYRVKNNFGPRLGITYAPKFLGGKTVLRAGGGIYYGPGQFEDLIQPIESNVFRTQQTFANGLTPTTVSTIGTPTGVVPPFTPRAYDTTGYVVPERVGQYSASIQQALPGNTVLTVAYVGSQGRNLFLRSITNTILPNTNPNGCDIVGPNAATGVVQTALPSGCGVVNRRLVAGGQVVQTLAIRQFDIPNLLTRNVTANGVTTIEQTARTGEITRPFGEIDYKTSGGRDRYDALQLQVQRRFARGLALGAQYTYAKSRGNSQGSNEAVTSQDPFNFNGEFGRNNFDIRHSGNLTALYELPVGNDRAVDLGSVGNFLLGGLQLGGIYNGRSGVPLNVQITRADLVAQCTRVGGCPRDNGTLIAQGTVARLPTGALPTGFVAVINTPGGNASRNTRRPDLIAGVDPFLDGSNGDKRFFLNPAAFAIPTAGAYGNYQRNFLSGPNFHQFDLTLQKRFRVTETANVEFRTEIFNIFNKANFANPPILLGENLPSLSAATNGNATLGSGLQPGQAFSAAQTANFGVINSTVGRTVGLGTNRQIQFALRLNF